MKFNRAYPFFGIVLACLLIFGLCVNPGLSQSRRQPPTSNEKKNKRPGETPPKEGEQEPLPKDLARYLDEVERDILVRALEHHRYNRTAAGISLGLSLRQMRYRMARLNVNVGGDLTGTDRE